VDADSGKALDDVALRNDEHDQDGQDAQSRGDPDDGRAPAIMS